ncbi:MAG TPA: hypothetical protein P5268_01525 [Candidatus Marinimicrobia bacterium]|mgnify:CR=1 FL=1|nr:hypothetical protein [Candidatus Neomarinimicrobiota bacterium]HRS50964.1 hypothetical protein [Candidatus Neomarinimicrobiota bacterium]HRU91694.1 hypothetical protein [Candidatus Neomarinimicrobiota bacterium]
MSKLSSAEIENIISLLKEGKPLPEEYKTILFDTNLAGRQTGKEYELVYADKEREVDILSNTMAVPLQKSLVGAGSAWIAGMCYPN